MVVHPRRPRAAETAVAAADWLRERGHDVRMPKKDADAVGLPASGYADDELVDGIEVALALGGDGTILRAVQLVCHHATPIIGVNLGGLGYLTSVEPDDVVPSLERFLAGSYGIEDRMMLAVTVERHGGRPADHGGEESWWGLNDAVVEKPQSGHTIHVAVAIDGRFWTTYAADGLIVATPTGSTAYAFSARGPIVSPRLSALLMTPVSPHMPFDRSLVVDSEETIRIEVTAERAAMLLVDGREVALLQAGDAIVCTAAPRPARFVTFDGRDFYGILKAKFGVADR
jgi:NAD+ kinase